MSDEIEGEIVNERTGEIMPVVQNSALVAVERASTDVQISTAKKYPRSVSKFQANILSFAKSNPKLAALCTYSKPQAGGTVHGPSARFAEMVATSWGNLRIGSRIVEVGESRIVVQGVCHDLETNILVSVEVPSGIMGRNGRYSEDLINTNLKAAMSKARRDAVLQVVPRAYWFEAMEVCQATAKGDIKSLEADRAAALEYLKRTYKVDAHRVFAALGVASEREMDLDRLADLKGYIEAIRAQEATVSGLFPEVARTETIKAKLDARKASARPPAEEKPAEAKPVETKPRLEDDGDPADDAK